MITADHINALFELAGSIAVWANIRQIWLDKGYAGMSLWALVFFTSWGAWNLIYYPSLGQWFSFGAGCSIFIANCVWIGLTLFYGKKQYEEKTKNMDRVSERPQI